MSTQGLFCPISSLAHTNRHPLTSTEPHQVWELLRRGCCNVPHWSRALVNDLRTIGDTEHGQRELKRRWMWPTLHGLGVKEAKKPKNKKRKCILLCRQLDPGHFIDFEAAAGKASFRPSYNLDNPAAPCNTPPPCGVAVHDVSNRLLRAFGCMCEHTSTSCQN